jgi:hypothetical protein
VFRPEVARLVRPDGGWCSSVNRQASKVATKDRLTQWSAGTPLSDKVSASDAGTWLHYTRPPLEGIGQWTHQYGSPTNASFAGESLSGVKESGELVTQWVGRPGPRYHPDRSGRKPGPLVAGGRLFAQGLNRLIASTSTTARSSGARCHDAANEYAARLQQLSADEKHLYAVVGSRCWKTRLPRARCKTPESKVWPPAGSINGAMWPV